MTTHLWLRFPMLASDYSVNDDVSQQLIWLNDPDGYSPHDETVTFSKMYIPKGYALLYEAAGSLFSNQWAILSIDLIRCLCVILLLWSILVKRGLDSWLGLALFLLLFQISMTIGDVGMPRSYASLFLLAAWAAETGVGRRYTLWSAAIALSGLFYPPSTVILGFVFLFVHAMQWIRTRRFPWPGWFPSGLMLVSVSVALWAATSASRDIRESPLGGPPIDKEFMLKDPHGSPQGRVDLRQFLKTPAYVYLKSNVIEIRKFIPVKLGGERLIFSTCVLIGICMFWASYRGVKGADPAAATFLSGPVLYLLAVILAFRLFQPNRYVQYTLLPSLMMFLVAGAAKLGGLEGRWAKPLKGLLLLLVACFVVSLKPRGYGDFKSHAKLYENVRRHVAPGRMIALNSLNTGNMIPWFTGRSVFVNYENLHAIYYRRQIELQDSKMAVWNRIFSLRSRDSLVGLLQENRIDALLLQEPYHALADTATIPAPYPRTWNDDNALRSLLEEMKPLAEFESDGRKHRCYDLRSILNIPASTDTSKSANPPTRIQ
jgi:hypothetical protein